MTEAIDLQPVDKVEISRDPLGSFPRRHDTE